MMPAAVHSQATAQASAVDEPIERPPRLEPEPPSLAGYRVGLGLTYLLAPVLFSISLMADDSPGYALAAIPVGLVGPPLYHLVWRQPDNALRAVAGTFLSMVVGAAVGTLVGLTVGGALDASRKPCEEDECYGLILGVVAGSGAGAGLGFVGWAFHDSLTAKYEPPPSRRRTRWATAALAPVLTPLVSAQEGRAAFTGAVLGLSGRL